MEFRHAVYVDVVPRDCTALLVGDIGGTNANFAFFSVGTACARMLFSLHTKSQEITDFTTVVQQVLAYAHQQYGITARQACFAAAGVVREDRQQCKPTNVNFTISVPALVQQSGLDSVFVVNDFEVIGYGLSCIDPKAIVQVHAGDTPKHANKAIIGAGTGLGKCIMTWNAALNRHVPVASEGGHADFPPHNQLELDLVNYIQRTQAWDCPISWEDVLSGNGIKRMYKFFCARNSGQKMDTDLARNGLHPDEIFGNRERDTHAFNTAQLYTQLYARCAKNFALDALALGGVYIAGGIAAKNVQLFQQPEFVQEFIQCGKQQDLLRKIPIFVIIDYNVSLYGVVQYMLLEQLCVM